MTAYGSASFEKVRIQKSLPSKIGESLLGPDTRNRDVDARTVADNLNKNDKPLQLEWPQRLMLRARFSTKGVVIGSQQFVEDILVKYADVLWYRKEHKPERTRVWDEVYCLKKHRVLNG